MRVRFILTGYVDSVMAHATYDKIEDSTFCRTNSTVQRSNSIWRYFT
jgi:hypothetical protein